MSWRIDEEDIPLERAGWRGSVALELTDGWGQGQRGGKRQININQLKCKQPQDAKATLSTVLCDVGKIQQQIGSSYAGMLSTSSTQLSRLHRTASLTLLTRISFVLHREIIISCSSELVKPPREKPEFRPLKSHSHNYKHISSPPLRLPYLLGLPR